MLPYKKNYLCILATFLLASLIKPVQGGSIIDLGIELGSTLGGTAGETVGTGALAAGEDETEVFVNALTDSTLNTESDLDSVIDTSDEDFQIVGGEEGENIPQAMQTQIAQARAAFNAMTTGQRAAQVEHQLIEAAENGNSTIIGGTESTGPFISGGGFS